MISWGGVFLLQNVGQGHIAVGADVLVNGFRIDDAAVAQGDAELMLVELGLGQGGDGIAGLS